MNYKQLTTSFQLNKWDLIEIKPLYKIYRNTLSGKHCQEYLVNLVSQIEKEIFLKRMNLISDHLISVFHCEFFVNPIQSKLNHCLAKIYLQKISIKLNQIIQLPADIISQFLEETLLGFKLIYQLYQPVRITSNMICFNQQNKVKIWISSNPLQNIVSNDQIITSQLMVSDIFKIFDQYTANYQDKPQLMNFEQALNYLNYKKLIIYSRSSTLSLINRCDKGTNFFDSSNLQKEKSQQQILKFKNYNQIVMNSPKNSHIQLNKVSKKLIAKTVCNQINNHPQNNFELNNNQLSKNDTFVRKQILKVKQIPDEDQLIKYINKKKFPTINIQSARTTSKTIILQDNLVEIDKNYFQQQLIDIKKSKDTKLQLIEKAFQNKNLDQNLRKICKIYDHALRYDPIMYHQLQKVQGRLYNISNLHILKRLFEITSQVNAKPVETSNISFKLKRQQKINKILQQQRMKRQKLKKKFLTQFQQNQSPRFVKSHENEIYDYSKKQKQSKQQNMTKVNILNNTKQKIHSEKIFEQIDEQKIHVKIAKQKQYKQQIKRIEQFKQQFQRLLFE